MRPLVDDTAEVLKKEKICWTMNAVEIWMTVNEMDVTTATRQTLTLGGYRHPAVVE